MAATIYHQREGEKQLAMAMTCATFMKEDLADMLRETFIPWTNRAKSADIMDATMKSGLIGKKLVIDWDRVPAEFRDKKKKRASAWWKAKRKPL